MQTLMSLRVNKGGFAIHGEFWERKSDSVDQGWGQEYVYLPSVLNEAEKSDLGIIFTEISVQQILCYFLLVVL